MADDTKLRAPRSSAAPGDVAVPEQQPNTDPLAELARLIGQDDVFEKMRRDAAGAQAAAPAGSPGPAPAAPGTPLRAPANLGLRGSEDPNARTLASRRPRAEESHAEPEPATYTPRPRAQREPSRATATPPQDDAAYAYPTATRSTAHGAHDAAASTGHYQAQAPYQHAQYQAPAQYDAQGAYPDDAYDPAYAYDDSVYADDQPPLERPRSGFKIVAAVLGIAVIGTAGAFGYWAFAGGEEGGQPPVIKANTAPTKVTPAAPNRDTSRTTFDGSRDRTQGERMLSREEQPVELRDARAATPRMPLPAASQGAVGMAGQPPAALAQPPAPPSTGAGSNEPKKVKTIRIPAEGANAPTTTGTAPRSGVSQPPVANRAPTALSTNQPSPTRTASIPTTTPEAPPSGQYVQVSSQRSEEDARASFRTLQQKYPSVLGNRQPVIRARDLGERGIRYRVQIGPFASADQANNLCENLKAAGGQCYVLRE